MSKEPPRGGADDDNTANEIDSFERKLKLRPKGPSRKQRMRLAQWIEEMTDRWIMGHPPSSSSSSDKKEE
ncbi:MAG TPA: hypothetical protein VJB96_04940 [Patescibacteria group bacterium]|nr:hypothetical protein [Patescibacteria group bacterium]